MKRVLRWIWAPALLGAALLCVPAKQAEAQTSFYMGGPRMSFGYSTGYYAPGGWGGYYPAPYRAYYGPRPYYGRPYYGHHHHHHHGHHGGRGRW